MEMIELLNVNKKYGNLTIYQNFNLNIKKGVITAILGESGVGKTTLLNIIASLTEYEGIVNKFSDKFAYVFQNDRLVPNLTVFENLKLICPDVDEEKLDNILQEFSLYEFKNYYPKELSKGMARRVALIRAIIFDADIVLMDEPFANLDISIKYKLMDLYLSATQNTNKTTIFVTHDVYEASYFADEIIVIKEGKVVKTFKGKVDGVEKDLIKTLTNK